MNLRRSLPGPVGAGFTLALASLLPAGLPAQETVPLHVLSAHELKRLSVEELLEQNVLSVSRRPETLAETAANVFYISGQAARTTGATSLPELLRLAPTLFVAQSSSYHWGINARGFMRTNAHSNKLLVLIDGRTAYLPLFSNVFWDATDIFLPDLDSIEVISGPSGSNWGSNAVNGVINIRTKSARETLGSFAEASGGTQGFQAAARHGWKLGARGAVRVYAKHTARDATLSPAGLADEADAWKSSQAGFRADWGDAERGELTFQGDWLAGRYDNLPANPIRNDAGHLMLRWSRQLSARTNLWWRAYYDYSLRDTSSLLTEKTRTADVEFQHSLELAGGQRLLWGANFRRIADSAEDTVGYAILPERLWMSLGAVFAQHETSWRDDRLHLTAGLRFEHNDFTGWETQPTVRLSWQEGGQTLWVAAARATRTPSRIDKGFFAPATPPYAVIGGPDFRSELLLSYEAGWRAQLVPGLVLTTTAYYHDYDHLRSVEPGPPVFEANRVAGKSYGLEWFLDYDVTAAWRLRAGGFVMNQHTWLKPGGADVEGTMGEGSFPDMQMLVRSIFRLSPDVDLWLGLRHVAEVPAWENGNGVVPAYTELDAQIGWRFRPGMQLSIFGRNLLDRSHPEIGGLNTRREIPRALGASLRWEF